MENDSDKKQLTIRMPKELHKRLKSITVKEDSTMNDMVIRLIEKYVKGK